MRLSALRIANLRNLENVQLEPLAGLNCVIGANGAGKTSLLEAIYVLSHAFSFRTRRAALLVRAGQGEATVFAEVESAQGRRRLGLQQAAGRWSARVDNQLAANLAEAIRHCAVVCFEPGSHALIAGPSEERRRFLDWGVFHVEPEFAVIAARYRRALRQRNTLLRAGTGADGLQAWDESLVAAAAPLSAARQRYFQRFSSLVAGQLSALLPELGAPILKLSSGWGAEDDPAAALANARSIDLQRGHTTRGPHRSDWKLVFAGAQRREYFSRGHEKLCALACMLAQADVFRQDHQEWPIVVLDDLPSELDVEHQGTVLRLLVAGGGQVFMSCTELPAALEATHAQARVFHVEQGQVRVLL